MTLKILGVDYNFSIKKYEDDPVFSKNGIGGYHDGYSKEIVLCDLRTYPGWPDELQKTIEAAQKSTLLHEIVHAFLHESGLSDSSSVSDQGWAKNEEMVDWIALQGPKIYKAWAEADAL